MSGDTPNASMPDISYDMREFIMLLHEHAVRFALCGGFAVAYHGFVRTTMDIDILIYPSAENADRLMRALDAFGFGQAGLSRETFERPGAVVTLGAQPNQIDLLTSMSSETPDAVFDDVRTAAMWGLDIPVVSRQALMRAKAESDRPKDRIDLDELQRITADEMSGMFAFGASPGIVKRSLSELDTERGR